MGEQTNLLYHIADFSPQLNRVLFHNIFSVDKDPSRRWFYQSVDHLHRRRFSAAARADKTDKFTFAISKSMLFTAFCRLYILLTLVPISAIRAPPQVSFKFSEKYNPYYSLNFVK